MGEMEREREMKGERQNEGIKLMLLTTSLSEVLGQLESPGLITLIILHHSSIMH